MQLVDRVGLMSDLFTDSFAIQSDLRVVDVNVSNLVVNGQTMAVSGDVSGTLSSSGLGMVTPFDLVFFEDLTGNSAFDPGVDRLFTIRNRHQSAPDAAGYRDQRTPCRTVAIRRVTSMGLRRQRKYHQRSERRK